MDKYYPAIVIGLGAIGSATLYQLTKLDVKGLGIEQFSSPHIYGSSHGDSRITRTAIGEGVVYTPLALRSHEIWRELEQLTGLNLLHQVGGIVISNKAPTGILHVEDFFKTTVIAAKQFNIPHRILNADDVNTQFSSFMLDQDEFAYYEPDAGYVVPENCIKAQLDLAARNGATIHMNEKLLSYSKIGIQTEIITDKGKYLTDKLIFTTGSWLPGMLPPQYINLMQVRRQVLYWFNIDEYSYYDLNLANMPVFLWELKNTGKGIYGFPPIAGSNGGIKIATESIITSKVPEDVNRNVSRYEVEEMHNLLKTKFPYLKPDCIKTVTCMYTVTPDHGFIIDWHPEMANVLLVSPCSGHGFKHSAGLGEAVAQLVHTNRSKINLDCFNSSRFS